MNSEKEFDIFISYRRTGGAVYSDFLYEKLSHLGYRVFQDKQELGSGFFDENINLAISRCSDVVVVLSSRALDRCLTDENDWVRVEIRTALESGKNVVPFITSHFSWPETLPEDIARFQFCNGPECNDRQLSECVEHRLPCFLKSVPQPSPGNERHQLVSHYEPPKGIFCGRETILLNLRKRLETDGNTVVLFGLGGIGKSEVAKAYSRQFRDCYKHIIFAHFKESMVQTFIDDGVFNITGIHRLLNETIRMESREKYFARKLAFFKELSGPETLIVLDDFPCDSEALDSALFEFLSGSYHVILTTRNNLSEYFPSIELTPSVCKEDALAIFSAYYGRSIRAEDADAVKTLLEHVRYHTLAIELIAKHMKISHLNPLRMLGLLRSEGFEALTGKVSAPHADMPPRMANEFIYSLFDLSKTTDEEQRILCAMAIMPRSGVNTDDFLTWTNTEEYAPVNNLVDRSWLSLDSESDKLSIHPVIRDLVLSRLKPDLTRCQSVMKTAERLWQELQGPIALRQWTDVIPTLELVHGWLEHLLDESNPFRRKTCNALAGAYYQMACYSEAYGYYEELCRPFMDKTGRIIASDKEMPLFWRLIRSLSNGYNQFEKSYRLAQGLLARATELYGDGTVKQMKYQELLAACAADMNLLEESYDLRKKTADFCVDNPDVSIGEQIRMLSALANTLSFLHRHGEAYIHRTKVSKMLNSLRGENDDRISLAQNNLALSAFGIGNTEEALALIQSALQLSVKTRGPDDFYTLSIRANRAMIMGANGMPDALSELQFLYERHKEIWGDSMLVTLKIQCNYAISCRVFGKNDEAQKMLTELEQKKASMVNFPVRMNDGLNSLRAFLGSSIEGVELSSLDWQTITFIIPSGSD